ncbi:triose-phosphate isomerase [Paenalcaligenes niemegkensis]|uniref:triose-phosphate isomerase n=1 Tax=Paenalcaligenes niemegkensis TaxID=2895469 RepID=UPI001EE7AE06|nr:triose-phosphate isomerase [Paenalcaligenes niemegkensis]MCQ9616942.1 triose-phosphate isomerase [Paenalcaligenes niemegkensis]
MTNHVARKRLVMGNWKMNASLEANASLLNALLSSPPCAESVEVAVCVPFPYLAQVQAALFGSAIQWGAQDVSSESQGAYTGETSAQMLRDFACEWVLVGHSERRLRHAESHEAVALKAVQALNAGLTPVFCVGETDEQHEAGETEAVVLAQLQPLLDLAAASVSGVVVAYEPVWAIGTGKSATPEQAQHVHAYIRSLLKQGGAGQVRILYGGSVNGTNASQLFAMPDIDGALVGGAALNAEEFLRIAAV